MFFLAGFVCVLYYTQLLDAVSLQIDGKIDLGPKWSYQYKAVTSNSESQYPNVDNYAEGYQNRLDEEHVTHGGNPKIVIQNDQRSRFETKTHTTKGDAVTELLEDFKIDLIYGTPTNIKEDNKINFFTVHIYKQTLKVFDSLRLKATDRVVKKQIDFLSRNYERKFKDFVKDTRQQQIKTRLGTQKVILNTIDMSNRILTRLINFLIGDIDKKGLLRNHQPTFNIFQKEVEKQATLEFDHACKKYGVCRTKRSFTDFLSDVMLIVLKTDDKKFKQGLDAFTEAFKNADFSNTLHELTEKKLKKAIVGFEHFNDIPVLRALITIVRNIINNKFRPLVIHNRVSAKINQTVALLELFDIVDNKIPNNEANSLEWNDLTKSFQQWADGKRTDILEIMESLVNLFKKSLESLDFVTRQRVDNLLNILI